MYAIRSYYGKTNTRKSQLKQITNEKNNYFTIDFYAVAKFKRSTDKKQV